MSDSITVPREYATVAVDMLSAEVVAGPDAGSRQVAEGDVLTVGTAAGNDLVLSDPTVSRYHLELARRPEGILVVDLGSTNGTFLHDARIERAVARCGAVLKLGDTSVRLGEGAAAAVPALREDSLGGLLGRSEVMRRLLAEVQLAAASEAPVLLLGESGTGKELLANALHELGPRASGPLVTVDCGAMPSSLVASELFGHERGAFTGADSRRIGAFEAARGGTLFLDEVGDLPPAQQVMLLGVLSRGRFRRVGGSEDLETDVRLVSATHRDLRSEINADRFRLDLYYRLSTVVLRVPPLRERREDIPLLIEHFLREAGYDGPLDAYLAPDALEPLLRHRWPGNVRELRNAIEASLVVGEEALPRRDAPEAEDALSYKEARAAVLHEFERRFLGGLLARTGGNVARAAREARMDRSHLIELLKRHGLR